MEDRCKYTQKEQSEQGGRVSWAGQGSTEFVPVASSRAQASPGRLVTVPPLAALRSGGGSCCALTAKRR
jgi:hypothetical protein